jgi:putative membrane protein
VAYLQIQQIINDMEYKYILASIIYSVIGIVILGISFWVFEKITPENIWKEIVDKHNIAIAIVSAAFMISIAIIIASAIHS